MAFFKFSWPGRKGQDDTKAGARTTRTRRGAPQAESADALRRRARHRLIGAAVLVVLGVVGFPLLFDTQPRPIAVDIPISIPDRNKAPALVLPGARPASGAIDAPATASAAPTQVASAAKTTGAQALDEGEEVIESSAPVPEKAPKPAPKPEPRPEPKPEAKPEPKPQPKPAAAPAAPAKTDDAARARALLEGHSAPSAVVAAAPAAGAAAESATRFVVQVGAFGELEKAQEVRTKLERNGLKTYVQSVDTKDGKRHRVRVGPFTQRSEADHAASRIRGLDFPASVLTL
ncbi:SPOR domain-containing protein [Xylophilus sp. GW821-FHT01B05]